MKTIRINNLDQWVRADGGLIVWRGTGERAVSLEVNPVGPVVAWYSKIVGKPGRKEVEKTLLAVIDGPTELIFRGEGDFAVELEGTAFTRRDQTPIFVEADPDLVSYTRFEKIGLYHDEIGMALHRQATLQRLQAADGAAESSQRAIRLERQLAESTQLLNDLREERRKRDEADAARAAEEEANAQSS